MTLPTITSNVLKRLEKRTTDNRKRFSNASAVSNSRYR